MSDLGSTNIVLAVTSSGQLSGGTLGIAAKCCFSFRVQADFQEQ